MSSITIFIAKLDEGFEQSLGDVWRVISLDEVALMSHVFWYPVDAATGGLVPDVDMIWHPPMRCQDLSRGRLIATSFTPILQHLVFFDNFYPHSTVSGFWS